MVALSELGPVLAATTRWLLAAYPPTGRALDTALARAQAQQAVLAACGLRYPTATDAALLVLLGPGGSGRLDRVTGTTATGEPWRDTVDEVLASWAACLLGDEVLAAAAVAALGPGTDYRRLTAPGALDRRAAALLRHPDLLRPVADLHRVALLDRLTVLREVA